MPGKDIYHDCVKIAGPLGLVGKMWNEPQRHEGHKD